MAALSEQLWQAAAGRITAREAMARTSREWDIITDRLGRAMQPSAPGPVATRGP
jgi:hypothetical protein